MNEGVIETDGEWPVVRFERHFKSPVERVWAAITDPEELSCWLADTEIELVEGGRFDLQFRLRADETRSFGRITAVVPNRLLEFTWYPDQLGDSRVRFELTPTEEGCTLVLTHRFPISYGVAETLGGWHVHLDALELLLSGTPFELRRMPWNATREIYLTDGELR